MKRLGLRLIHFVLSLGILICATVSHQMLVLAQTNAAVSASRIGEGSMSGRVSLESGRPAVGASIAVRLVGTSSVYWAETDINGKWRIQLEVQL
jgi:hypothetical protein